MPGTWCRVCNNSKSGDPNASFHRFPTNLERRAIWLTVFNLQEKDTKPHHRVCSRHFLNGDVKNKPETNPGKRFPSPLKSGPRAKRAKNREANKQLIGLYSTTGSLTSTSESPTPSSSKSVTTSTIIQPPLSVADVGEQLVSDYQVHELPNNVDDASSTLPTNGLQSSSLQTVPLVNAALLARVGLDAFCPASCWNSSLCFKEKFPNTFAIIDGSEIFIETPTDLQMQSSTWSQYKYHNTAKFLIACTPNGAVSYVSPLYVGSISDVELTPISGFLTKLEDKPGISIMADQGFTVKDMLETLGIDLNIPPFLDGRQQLPYEVIEAGRKIASFRIHVERAIGRIETYKILKSTIPLSMARLSNQIVCICAFLSNFHPALVPKHHPKQMLTNTSKIYLTRIMKKQVIVIQNLTSNVDNV
ncbi:hypothetical protein EMCRGX_G033131 [Ephydatia muelleri]